MVSIARFVFFIVHWVLSKSSSLLAWESVLGLVNDACVSRADIVQHTLQHTHCNTLCNTICTTHTATHQNSSTVPACHVLTLCYAHCNNTATHSATHTLQHTHCNTHTATHVLQHTRTCQQCLRVTCWHSATHTATHTLQHALQHTWNALAATRTLQHNLQHTLQHTLQHAHCNTPELVNGACVPRARLERQRRTYRCCSASCGVCYRVVAVCVLQCALQSVARLERQTSTYGYQKTRLNSTCTNKKRPTNKDLGTLHNRVREQCILLSEFVRRYSYSTWSSSWEVYCEDIGVLHDTLVLYMIEFVRRHWCPRWSSSWEMYCQDIDALHDTLVLYLWSSSWEVYPTERVREKIFVPYWIEFVSGVLWRHWCPTQDSGILPAVEFVRGVYGIEVMVCRLQCDIQNLAGNNVGTLPAIEFVRGVYTE